MRISMIVYGEGKRIQVFDELVRDQDEDDEGVDDPIDRFIA